MSRAAFVPRSELLFLVVDDDNAVRKTVIEYLNAFGYEKVIEAPNAIEALSMLEGHPVDFVISDWEMPGLSGLELLRTMRKDERFKDTPFVMVTAPISHENLKIEQAAISEVDAYILKPFRSNVLLEKIEEALEECRERARKGVIVVDDEPEVRSLVVEILRTMGYDPIFEAADGDEGFDLLNRNPWRVALVVCDWEMPKMSGIEFLQKIRIDRDLGATPFLMITSQTSIEHLKIQKAIEADVDHYLLKPFTPSDFRKKVALVLDSARSEKQVLKKLARAIKADRDGDIVVARALYHQVIELDPKNIDAYLGLAHIKIKTSAQTGFDECIQMIKNAIKLNPKLDRSYIALAMAFEKGVSLEKAIVILGQGIRKCPPSAQLFFESGRLLHRIGKFEDSAVHLGKALELQPDLVEARKLMHDAYSRIK